MSVRMLTTLMRAFYVVILARYLGPEMFGLFAYGQSWYIAFLPSASGPFSAARSAVTEVAALCSSAPVSRSRRYRPWSAPFSARCWAGSPIPIPSPATS